MSHRLVTLVTVTCAVLLGYQKAFAQPGPQPVGPPAFNALPLKPTLNPNTNTYDVGLNGSFANLTAPLKVKFTIRDSSVAGDVFFPALDIVEGTIGMGQQGTITRNTNTQTSETFNEFVNMLNYKQAGHTCKMRIVFWSGPAIIMVYTQGTAAGNDWTAIP